MRGGPYPPRLVDALTNRNFKHAKPSTFNDTEDLTIRSIFPEDDAEALKQIENGFTDVLMRHLNDPPTCFNIMMRKKVDCCRQYSKPIPTQPSASRKPRPRVPRRNSLMSNK
jgi:hypothetical protein